ncbi:ATP-dependent Zn protease [Falsochrobactrum shanghaiense]|uniref:ATP-dependent Zn protease n=1 Tax=Falsochrobactrum shanghaiense TaxID=2201899 RepID=A0A316J4H4_9HYPH|nr:ATP-dependent Zn protease [Falsochrobactrum shanghaiense]PWL16286.1 ATP-dependent Zn protease [Falsochrobactrum shanghaiense]
MTGCKSDERLKSLRDLRSLALKAQGMTGADIERIVRQARQQARRKKRQLTWKDIENGITGNRRSILPEERWRMAVHEAGHALILHILQTGHPLTLSIEEQVGFGFATERRKLVLLEKDCEDNLAVMLAGRAAEELVLGDVSVGSGMRPGSDLSNATDLALAMETTYGFARERPLLFCDGVARGELLREKHPVTNRVDERLQKAYDAARHGLVRYAAAHRMLAEALLEHGVLEGETVTAILNDAVQRQDQQSGQAMMSIADSRSQETNTPGPA